VVPKAPHGSDVRPCNARDQWASKCVRYPTIPTSARTCRRCAISVEREWPEAGSVYEKMIDLYPGCGSTTRNAPRLNKLAVPSARLEE
jgi:hypothetical protein